MRNQKWRKNSVIVSIVCSTDLLALVDEAVATQRQRTRQAPLNRSSWIVRAINRALDHRRRSRRSNHETHSGLLAGLAAEGQSVPSLATGPEGQHDPLDQRPEAAAEGQGGSVANLDLSVDIRQPQESMGLGTSSQAVGDTDANPAPHLGQGMAGPASVRSEPQWPLVGPGPLLPASAATFVADLGAAEGG